MRTCSMIVIIALSLALSSPILASQGDDSKLRDATRQVESGAKAVGSGLEETAKGVGHTVVEGARTAGDKLREAGKAAEPQAKTAWQYVRDGAISFGYSVKNFFTKLVGD